MLTKSIALSIAATLIGVASPAAAATVTFDFSGSTALTGTFGTSSAFAGTNSPTTINVRASAWSATPSGNSYTIATAFMGQYSHGLGATATGDSAGANNLHTLDNLGTLDFILLQFDQVVKLGTGVLTPFAVGGSTDNDATVGVGTTATPWTTKLDLTNAAVWGSLLTKPLYSVKGTGAVTPTGLNPSNYAGNVWIVGADFFNTDGADGFKLNTLTAAPAPVPEPASWAMMIGGFGLIGGAMRRTVKAPAPALA